MDGNVLVGCLMKKGIIMDLFQNASFEDLLAKLNQLTIDLTKVNELPDRGIIVKRNYGTGKKTDGKLISYSISSNEPDYPASKEEMKDENRHQTVFITLKAPLAIKWQGFVEFQLASFVLERFPPPKEAQVVPKLKKAKVAAETLFNESDDQNIDPTSTDDSYNVRLMIPITSHGLIDWVKSIVQYRITHYVTAAAPFGCCDLFERCSDAQKCIHANRMYSTACSYRHNLEAGRIFYGKNRNV